MPQARLPDELLSEIALHCVNLDIFRQGECDYAANELLNTINSRLTHVLVLDDEAVYLQDLLGRMEKAEQLLEGGSGYESWTTSLALVEHINANPELFKEIPLPPKSYSDPSNWADWSICSNLRLASKLFDRLIAPEMFKVLDVLGPDGQGAENKVLQQYM